MSCDTVPFYHSLSDIYDPTILQEQIVRYNKLYDKFVRLYNVPPSYVVRAPGRVNLIVQLFGICFAELGRTYRLLQFWSTAYGYSA